MGWGKGCVPGQFLDCLTECQNLEAELSDFVFKHGYSLSPANTWWGIVTSLTDEVVAVDLCYMLENEVEDFSQIYRRNVDAVLSNSVAAQSHISEVRNWQARHGGESRRRSLSPRLQVKVFRRDRFTCRFCGRRAVFPPVLRLLSVLFPSVFPYHPHGKMEQCHLAFWRDIASCDHLVPVARRGGSDLENLVTSCYMCNSIKQNWLVEELRWELKAVPEAGTWDGLTGTYPALLKACEDEHPACRSSYYRGWLRALKP